MKKAKVEPIDVDLHLDTDKFKAALDKAKTDNNKPRRDIRGRYCS